MSVCVHVTYKDMIIRMGYKQGTRSDGLQNVNTRVLSPGRFYIVPDLRYQTRYQYVMCS